MIGGMYPSIKGPFKRDEATHKIVRNLWSMPEFEYLSECEWRFTEKVDGTNVRFSAHAIMGRTDKAELHKDLVAHMESLPKPPEGITIYGEGHGPGIQKGGGRYRDDKGFIAFDASYREAGGEPRWLGDDEMRMLCAGLSIPVVPVHFVDTLFTGIEEVTLGAVKSLVAGDNELAEGLVGKPTVPLYSQYGNRIVVKVKASDFLGS